MLMCGHVSIRAWVLLWAALGLCGCSALSTQSQNAGVHARFAYSEHGGLRVVEIAAEGPAAAAGLAQSDQVIRIEGRWVSNLSSKQIVQALRGRAGTRVSLTVRRGADTLELKIERAPYLDHELDKPR